MSLWPFGKRKDQNTIDLSGDMDDVELILDIEQTFEIKVSDSEAKITTTIGDLEQLIRSKFAQNNKDDALWRLLCRVVRDHSGHKGSINRDTTFFAEDAKVRMNNG